MILSLIILCSCSVMFFVCSAETVRRRGRKMKLYDELSIALDKIVPLMPSAEKIELYTKIIDLWTDLLAIYNREGDKVKAAGSRSTIELYRLMVENERIKK